VTAFASAGAYLCLECTARTDLYTGQCHACGAWGSLVMKGDVTAVDSIETIEIGPARPRAKDIAYRPERIRIPTIIANPEAVAREPASELTVMSLSAARVAEGAAPRIATGIAELDRVLGGGLVDGSVVLLGGSPGSGKSTCLMQVTHALVRAQDGCALYASGEENESQVALRAQRIGVEDDRIVLVATNDIDRVLTRAANYANAVLVIDSIQTLRTHTIDSPTGSALQVVEVVSRVARFAKDTKTPAFLIGHVTKDGEIAGPKTLEHLVDVVLYLEGQGAEPRRLTSPKNRFGSTAEVGLFDMTAAGLACADAEPIVVSYARGAPGSAIFPAAIGERVQLVEIQALVGAPKSEERPRGSISVSGVDAKRVAMILAVLARHTGIDVSDRDVYVSTGAGARVSEPAADLAIALAIASSTRNLPIALDAVCLGELGLAGEIRPTPDAERRLAASSRGGFSREIGRGADLRTIADAIAAALPTPAAANATETIS
jgi:DNA repair protein RadA/Sms